MKCVIDKNGVPFCDKDATVHLLLRRDPDIVTWMCDQHALWMLEHRDVLDIHNYDLICEVPGTEGGRWHMSTPEHVGFCYVAGFEYRLLEESYQELMSV